MAGLMLGFRSSDILQAYAHMSIYGHAEKPVAVRQPDELARSWLKEARALIDDKFLRQCGTPTPIVIAPITWLPLTWD
jgi:hypothetical protein